jgi:hypothetical protein
LGRDSVENCNPDIKERNLVKRKPDFLLILMAAFGVGVLLTLLLPMAANNTVAAPASELQAGVIIRD